MSCTIFTSPPPERGFSIVPDAPSLAPRVSAAMLLWAALSAAAPVIAAQPSEAELLAPYLDVGTSLVLRLEVGRPSLDDALEQLASGFEGPSGNFARQINESTKHLQNLRAAGGKRLYLLLNALDPHQGSTILMELSPTADVQKIAATLPPTLKSVQRGSLLILGSESRLKQLDEIKPVARPELSQALAAAGPGLVSVIFVPTADMLRFFSEKVPKLPQEVGGASTTPFVEGIHWAALNVNLRPKPAIDLTIESPDAARAARFSEALAQLVETAATNEELKKNMPKFGALTKHLVPVQAGARLSLRLSDKNGGLTALKEAVGGPLKNAGTAAQRQQAQNQMKQIMLAMHNYLDSFKRFPPAGKTAPNGKQPLLSWRVRILPYIEEQQLYQQFKLNEPWDSEHNKKLIEKMPAIYAHPASKVSAQHKTVYLTPRGEGTIFPGKEGVKLRDITDGTSKTIALVEVDDKHAVIWTKPDDWELDPKQPKVGLGGQFEGGFNAGVADGSVRFMPGAIDADTLNALFTRAGKEPVDFP